MLTISWFPVHSYTSLCCLRYAYRIARGLNRLNISHTIAQCKLLACKARSCGLSCLNSKNFRPQLSGLVTEGQYSDGLPGKILRG